MDKKNAAQSLHDQRKIMKFKTGKTQLDQYELIQCGMRLVRQLQPATWVVSFRRVNLDPTTRLPFQEWCNKIKNYIRAGELFKEESVDITPQQKFALLPPFWHGMTPGERRVVMAVIDSHSKKYSAECIYMLCSECNLLISHIADVRVCAFVSREHPETLDYDASCLTITNDTQVPDNNYHATKQNDGLDTFQLIPKEADGRPKLTGMDLFQHMVTFRNVNHSRVDEDGQHVKIIPSTELNVEISSDALKCIQPTQSELRRANILHDSFGKRAIRKCAKRKLNNIGNIVGQCAVVNDETNMARMRENLVFAESMAEIVRREKANKTNKERDSM